MRCNVFNDGAWSYAQDKSTRSETTIELEHGKPLIFGKNRDRGIRLNGLSPEVVDLSTGKFSHDDLLFHDEKADPALVNVLARMRHPEFPEPIGVFRAIEQPVYEDQVIDQIDASIESRGAGDLNKLFNAGETWQVA